MPNSLVDNGFGLTVKEPKKKKLLSYYNVNVDHNWSDFALQ